MELRPAANDEPNPPVWPTDTVTIVRETDDEEIVTQKLVATQDSWNEDHQSFSCDLHFSSRRHAVLFAPGTYDFHFEVGYYVQVAGLGKSPNHVRFVNGGGPFVPSLNRHLWPMGTSLDTFWRSAENFCIEGDMLWAVSQASPLRRVVVKGDLFLHDKAAYASGGHLANAKIHGHLYAGGQQQYLIRNVELGGGATGGAWSMVYVGCTGTVPERAAGTGASPSVTVVDSPRVRVEKPYVALKDDGIQFELRIPLVQYDDKDDLVAGPILNGSHERVVDFSRVCVVEPSEQSSRIIQQALDEGKDMVLSPGIYVLRETVEMRRPNQVLLGLGMATLINPQTGGPCVHVESEVPGVTIAGIMLEASEKRQDDDEEKTVFRSLLEWGEEGKVDSGSRENPGALFDVFCRVGGASTASRESISVDTMVRIHSGHVIGDNLWLWRADHAQLLAGEEPNYPSISPIYFQSEENHYRVETGFEVFGDDVTLYGLAVEHANGHQTVWSGERGAVHFYQCEFPYCVTQESFGQKKYSGYRVAENVNDHVVYAPGIYSNFRNGPVQVSTAIKHPERASIVCINPFTVKLNNHGVIASIANGNGDAALEKSIAMRMTKKPNRTVRSSGMQHVPSVPGKSGASWDTTDTTVTLRPGNGGTTNKRTGESLAAEGGAPVEREQNTYII